MFLVTPNVGHERLVDAFSPHEARRNARLEEHLVVDRVIEVKRPRTGILGIGRQPGTYTVIVAPPPCYRVSWTRPWWVLVKSGEKISVRVTFRRIGS